MAFTCHGKLCFELVHLLQVLHSVTGFCMLLPGCFSFLAYGHRAYVLPHLLSPLPHFTFTAGQSPGLLWSVWGFLSVCLFGFFLYFFYLVFWHCWNFLSISLYTLNFSTYMSFIIHFWIIDIFGKFCISNVHKWKQVLLKLEALCACIYTYLCLNWFTL